MYRTRYFSIGEEAEYIKLIQSLSMKNIEYELLKPKKNHLKTIPIKQQFRAIVSWEDVQDNQE